MATGKIFQKIPSPVTKMAKVMSAPKTTVSMPKAQSITQKPALLKNISPSVASYRPPRTSVAKGIKGFNSKLI